jgi:hypothetical protein
MTESFSATVGEIVECRLSLRALMCDQESARKVWVSFKQEECNFLIDGFKSQQIVLGSEPQILKFNVCSFSQGNLELPQVVIVPQTPSIAYHVSHIPETIAVVAREQTVTHYLTV